jgi:hypothetical protein
VGISSQSATVPLRARVETNEQCPAEGRSPSPRSSASAPDGSYKPGVGRVVCRVVVSVQNSFPDNRISGSRRRTAQGRSDRRLQTGDVAFEAGRSCSRADCDDALLEASPPGRNWPSVRDARALVIGGLRVRGWAWSLSMVWVAAGAVITGYIFYATTPNYISADIIGTGIIGFSAGCAAVQIAAVLALVAWLALPLPVLIAGLMSLRGWRAANWLRAAAWAGAWIAGGALLLLACAWGDSPGVSWGSCQSVPRGWYSGP